MLDLSVWRRAIDVREQLSLFINLWERPYQLIQSLSKAYHRDILLVTSVFFLLLSFVSPVVILLRELKPAFLNPVLIVKLGLKLLLLGRSGFLGLP